jgi:hypothetical protein
MVRKMGDDLLSIAEFARCVGVSGTAIRKAIVAGRIQAYSATGRPVSANYRGRKFLKLSEALEGFVYSRVRIDDRALELMAAYEVCANGDD